MKKADCKYEHIYTEKHPLSGRIGWVGSIYKNNKTYRTGWYTERYDYKPGSNYIKIVINDPIREAVIALDKIIIKNNLDKSNLQILKPK